MRKLWLVGPALRCQSGSVISFALRPYVVPLLFGILSLIVTASQPFQTLVELLGGAAVLAVFATYLLAPLVLLLSFGKQSSGGMAPSATSLATTWHGRNLLGGGWLALAHLLVDPVYFPNRRIDPRANRTASLFRERL